MTFSRLLISFLISILLCTNAFCLEYLEALDDKTLSVLNDMLQDVDRRISDNETVTVDSVTGVLPLANGGTGSNLVDPNADRIGFWDDSVGIFTWLTPGTNLSITGTTLNATSVTPDLTFKSKTTWSGTTNSGNITLSANKGYLVHIEVSPDINSDCTLLLRFNSSSAANYENIVATTNAIALIGTDSLDDVSSKTSFVTLHMYTVQTDGMAVQGTTFYLSATSGSRDSAVVGGVWDAGTTITDFEIVTGVNSTGKVFLYELSES